MAFYVFLISLSVCSMINYRKKILFFTIILLASLAAIPVVMVKVWDFNFQDLTILSYISKTLFAFSPIAIFLGEKRGLKNEQ